MNEQGVLCKEGRSEVYHKWSLILQLGVDHKRGWRGRRAFSVNKGVQDRVASHVTELGPELAEQCLPKWTESFIPTHNQ